MAVTVVTGIRVNSMLYAILWFKLDLRMFKLKEKVCLQEGLQSSLERCILSQKGRVLPLQFVESSEKVMILSRSYVGGAAAGVRPA